MTVEEALSLLTAGGLRIAAQDRLGNDTGWRLKLHSGQIVNVFDNGNFNVQGKDPTPVRRLLEAVGRDRGRRVFVVYGHDDQALTKLDAMLRRWQLDPLILGQLPSGGQTVIEKLEHYQQDVAFGVVLATPDDEGHRREHPDEKLFRVRQNVVLELGMLLASPSLGRRRVAILLREQGEMERPSDIQGLIYIPFRDSVTEVGTQLAKELTQQGVPIALEHL